MTTQSLIQKQSETIIHAMNQEQVNNSNWKMKTHFDEYITSWFTIIDSNEMQITFHSERNGRTDFWEISLYVDKDSLNYDDRKSVGKLRINVSKKKDFPKIAKEIQSRLIDPNYGFWERAKEGKKNYLEYERKKKETFLEIVRFVSPEKLNIYGDCDHQHIYLGKLPNGSYGDVESNTDTTVALKLHSVPVEAAKKILAILQEK